MGQILNSDTISLIGLFVGPISLIVSISYGFYLHRKQIRSKRLFIDQIDPVQIANIKQEANTQIEMKYNGVPVTGVWRSRILMWNKGYRAITDDDFLFHPNISLIPSGTILNSEIESIDVSTNANLFMDDKRNIANIEISIIRPGEGLVIYLDTDTVESNPNFSIKTKDSDPIGRPGFFSKLYQLYAILLFIACAFIGMFLVLFIAAEALEYLNVEPLGTFVSAILAFVAFFCGAGFAFGCLYIYSFFEDRRLSPVVKSFYKRKY